MCTRRPPENLGAPRSESHALKKFEADAVGDQSIVVTHPGQQSHSRRPSFDNPRLDRGDSFLISAT